ncbi:MAG: hypothetical protein WCY43_00895 [Patescibacteria group bacterium]|nr:hypothetical protein [Patescibacteria group bacterium]
MDKDNKKKPDFKDDKINKDEKPSDNLEKKDDLNKKDKKEKKENKKESFSFIKSLWSKIKNRKIKAEDDLDNLHLLESDLIKGEVPIYFELNKHLIAFFALLLVSFVLIMELYFLLSWWEKNRSIENSYYLQDEISVVNKEKSELEQKYVEVFNFKNKMSSSFSVLDKHTYWTRFFSFLEQNTLKNVYFKKFSGDIGGSYILPSVTDDVRAISYQSKYFSADRRAVNVFISDEEIGEGGIGPDSGFVNFNINLNLDPKTFTNF